METTNVTLTTAFLAGFISFLTPCIVPVLPTYAAVLAGAGGSQNARPSKWQFLLNALYFLSGYIAVFVAMGVTASYFGQLLFNYQQLIRKVGALIMIVLGIHLAAITNIHCLQRRCRPLMHKNLQGPSGAFLLGVTFTLGWTPCTGPILATILVYAGTAATVSQGALLLFSYAMGFCVPFFVTCFIFQRYLITLPAACRWLPVVQKLAGVALIVVGILSYLNCCV